VSFVRIESKIIKILPLSTTKHHFLPLLLKNNKLLITFITLNAYKIYVLKFCLSLILLMIKLFCKQLDDDYSLKKMLLDINNYFTFGNFELCTRKNLLM